MKIVQLNCVYANGSTGKIVQAIHRYLQSKGDESHVLYGYGPGSDDPCAIRVVPPVVRKVQSLRSRLTGYPYGGAVWGTLNSIRLLERLQPDVVHLHCYNAYIANIYKVLNYLKESNIPTVLTNHAEFMYTGGCTHSLDCNKWLTGCGGCQRIGIEHPISWFFDRTHEEWELLRKAYDTFDRLTVCCVSDWVRDRAARSPFYTGRPVLTVLNGLDTNTLRYRQCSELRSSLHIKENQKVVIHVTPGFASTIKGGHHVLEMARRMSDVTFLVVGDSNGIKTSLQNVLLLGRAESQIKLAEYYSIADVCLLTSQRESYSMVTAESLSCGTPVVGFKAGGPETIAVPRASAFVEQGDDDALESRLREFLDMNWDKAALSSEGSKVYGEEHMCTEYRDLYLDILRHS